MGVAMRCPGFVLAVGVLGFLSICTEAALAAGAGSRFEIRLAGSSAHEPGLLALLRLTRAGGLEICQPGSLHVYSTGKVESQGHEVLYRCAAGRDAGAPPGSELVLAKTAQGGSGGAVGALLRGTQLEAASGARIELSFLAPAAPALLSTPGVMRPAVAPLSAYVFHSGVPSSVKRAHGAPDLALSDLEPAQFAHRLRPPLAPGELRRLASLPVSSMLYGVPLSRGLWQRLQVLEFPASSPCNPQHPDYGGINLPGSRANSLACMPSLSKAQVQGLLTGLLQDWRDLQSPLGGQTDVASASAPGLAPLASTQVYVERRQQGSGTQRAFEIFFNAGRCGEAGLAGVGAPGVHVNQGNAELLHRLARHDAEGRGAIGMLPTTLVAKALDRWRFVKISGTPPSLRAAVTGQWELWFEGSLHLRAQPGAGFPAAAPAVKAFAAVLARGLGSPGLVRHLNTQSHQLFGPAGLMANGIDHAKEAPRAPLQAGSAGSGQPGDVVDRPVALVSRGAGGPVDACASPVAVGPTPTELP